MQRLELTVSYDLERSPVPLWPAVLFLGPAAQRTRGHLENRQGSNRAEDFCLHAQGESTRPFFAHYRGRERAARYDHRPGAGLGRVQETAGRNGQSFGGTSREAPVERAHPFLRSRPPKSSPVWP